MMNDWGTAASGAAMGTKFQEEFLVLEVFLRHLLQMFQRF